jgi:hypothetical protein
MSADLSTSNWAAEDLALLLAAAPAKLDAKRIPGILQLSVAAEVEDALALLRTAVILARHFGVSLIVDLPETIPGRTGCANSGMEMHLGSAPCSAMISELLHSVEQRLKKLSSNSSHDFLVEFGFLVESRGFLFRIRSAGASHQSRSQRQTTATDNPAGTISGPSK